MSGGTRLALTLMALAALSGCAGTLEGGGSGADDLGGGKRVASDGTNPDDRMSPQANWVAVYESPPGTAYGDRQVIYVDRRQIRAEKLDGLTVYLGRSREVNNNSGNVVRELAVICEGTPKAPAISVRAEGTQDGRGAIKMQNSPKPLSLDQFTTQRLRVDEKNPSTFVVRALCLLGMDRGS